MLMKKAAFLGNDTIDRVYGMGRQQRVAEITDLYPVRVADEILSEHLAELKDVEAIFTTWGFPALNDEILDQLPALKIVLYAAGSVKFFAVPMLKRGISVVSGRVPNGTAVARFTCAQICLACKGYFVNARAYSEPGGRQAYMDPRRGLGFFGETVAILGLGAVGRQVAAQITEESMTVMAVDPTVSEVEARELGVELVSVEEAFEKAYVVTNHLPNLESLQSIIGEGYLRSMRENATFINTGRGGQVDQQGLVRAMRDRPDLTALLDVTVPEPLPDESELFTLPNVTLTTHIAGALGNEVVAMADFVIDEFLRWQDGKPLSDPIRLEDLDSMA